MKDEFQTFYAPNEPTMGFVDMTIKVVKTTSLSDRLREAQKLSDGQNARTNSLLVDVLLDVVARLERLERDKAISG